MFKKILQSFLLLILIATSFSFSPNTSAQNRFPSCPAGFTYSSISQKCEQIGQASIAKTCPEGITPTSRGTCYKQSLSTGSHTCPYTGNLVAYSATGAAGAFGVDIPDTEGLVCYINQSTPPAQNPPFAHNGCNPVTTYCPAAFGAYGKDNNGIYSYNVMYNPEGFRCPQGFIYLITGKWCAIEATETYNCASGYTLVSRRCIKYADPISSSQTSSSSISSSKSNSLSSSVSSQTSSQSEITFQFATRRGKEGNSNWLSPTNNWAPYNCSVSTVIDGVNVSKLTQYCNQAIAVAQSLNQKTIYGFRGLYSYLNGNCVEFTAFAFKVNGAWQWRSFSTGDSQGTVVNSWSNVSDSGCPS